MENIEDGVQRLKDIVEKKHGKKRKKLKKEKNRWEATLILQQKKTKRPWKELCDAWVDKCWQLCWSSQIIYEGINWGLPKGNAFYKGIRWKKFYGFCMNFLNDFCTSSARDKYYDYCSNNGQVKVKMPS